MQRSHNALSAQQKDILKDGLRAHYRRPMDIMEGLADPGCFGVGEGRSIDIDTGRLLPILDHKAREVRRTSKARAVARLIGRGLLECGSRTRRWRLTANGVTVAKKLHPELQPMGKALMQQQAASTIAFRDTIHSVIGPRAQARKRHPGRAQAQAGGLTPGAALKRSESVQALPRVAPAGLEIELDW